MNKKNKLNILFILVVIFFSIAISYKITKANTGFSKANIVFNGLESRINDQSENKRVQVNFYSELAKSFINGQLSFTTSPDAELLAHPNPYSAEAFKLTMQDGSLYKGKYYVYYGVPPVALLYLPVYEVFGFIPTDALIYTLLGIIYVSVIAYLSILIYKKSPIMGGVFFTGFILNPVIINCLIWINTSVVARMFCCLLLMISVLLIWVDELKGLRNKSWKIISVIILMTLSSITRPGCVLDFLIITSYISYKNRDNLKALFTGYCLSALLWVLNLYYNYIRFDSIFENGQKYITNGVDYVKNGPLLQIPRGLFEFFHTLIYRIYEYFFVLPGFREGMLTMEYSTHPPAMKGSYNAGVIGYFIFTPALLIALIIIFKNIHKLKNINLTIAAFTVFFLNFILMALLPLSHFGFLLEIIPRLGILTFLLMIGSEGVKISRPLLIFMALLCVLPIDATYHFIKY